MILHFASYSKTALFFFLDVMNPNHLQQTFKRTLLCYQKQLDLLYSGQTAEGKTSETRHKETLLILFTAIEFSLGGSSPYTIQTKQ